MGDDLFSRCGTSYLDFKKLIRSLAGNIARRYGCYDLIEELESQGWMAAIESLEHYDRGRKAKATSYAYPAILGSMLDAVRQHCQFSKISDGSDEDLSAYCVTDSTKKSLEFDPNPYRMQPDIVYDVRRRQRLAQSVMREHPEEVASYGESIHGADACARKRHSRYRQKLLVRLREQYRKWLKP